MDTPEPIVSIITATYNWSNVLRLAIESVLWQTRQDFEMLVIGDGCTDDSAEVVASFGDPRIRWHNLPANSGNQSAPNNAGIAMARGKYIAYLGHDDIWLPDHLASHLDAIEKTGADLTYSWLEMLGPEPVTMRQMSGITTSEKYDGDAVLPPTSIMHRHALAEEVGPWKDYRSIPGPTDQEFILRIFQAGRKFASVQKLTALKFNAAWRPGCYVKKYAGQQEDAIKRIKENPDFRSSELHAFIENLAGKYPDEIIKRLFIPENSQPGRQLEQVRRLRGVEAKPLPPVKLPEQFPPLPESIDMSDHDADRYLWEGWSWPETRFRWTDDREASVIFGMDKPAHLEMRLLAAPFLVPGKLDMQSLAITCNGEKVAQFELMTHTFKTLRVGIKKSLLQDNNTITLNLPHAAMPLSFGDSLDTRVLGVQVSSIEFERI